MTADGATRSATTAFHDYLTEVGRDLAAGNATEHTHRPALKGLLIALDPDVRPVNEPRRIECGAPDFIVTRNELPVGYIEAKDVGRSLDEIERDEQLKRYRESLSNLILTDYLEFRWFKDGEKQQSARIAYVGDSGKLRPDREGQTQAAAMFGSFLAQEPPIVGNPVDLAKRMAALTRIVRDIVRSALEHDRSSGSPRALRIVPQDRFPSRPPHFGSRAIPRALPSRLTARHAAPHGGRRPRADHHVPGTWRQPR